MRIWAFPSFYPIDKPGLKWAGIFAHRQYKALIENGAELVVILPVLWHPPFPFAKLNDNWATLAQNAYPYQRIYDGITVYHPALNGQVFLRTASTKH
jgi:hypothetical protein